METQSPETSWDPIPKGAAAYEDMVAHSPETTWDPKPNYYTANYVLLLACLSETLRLPAEAPRDEEEWGHCADDSGRLGFYSSKSRASLSSNSGKVNLATLAWSLGGENVSWSENTCLLQTLLGGQEGRFMAMQERPYKRGLTWPVFKESALADSRDLARNSLLHYQLCWILHHGTSGLQSTAAEHPLHYHHPVVGLLPGRPLGGRLAGQWLLLIKHSTLIRCLMYIDGTRLFVNAWIQLEVL